LISSLGMLVVVLIAMQVYSIRKTGDLLRIGAEDYTRCALAGAYPHQTDRKEMTLGLGLFGPVLQPVLDQATGDEVVAAHQCMVNDRTYFEIILQRGRTLIAVALTRRTATDAFPRSLMADTVKASGTTVHEGRVDGYSVAGFESGNYLAYVVAALPKDETTALAARLVPVIRKYTQA
jgi:hypothetical protein